MPTSPDAAWEVLREFEARLDRIADDIVEAIWRGAPAYATHGDAGLRELVRENVLETCRLALRWLARGTQAVPDEISTLARQRHVAGITATDLVTAYQVGLAAVWDELEDIARAIGGADVLTLPVAGQVTHIVTACMGIHIHGAQEEQSRLREDERESHDRALFEELLRGAAPAPGPQRDRARRAGLDEDSRLVVISAHSEDGELEPRHLARAVGRTIASPHNPLTVVVVDEVVAIVSVADPACAGALADRLRDLPSTLAAPDVRVAIGVSTVHDGWLGVGPATSEARAARERAGADGCVAFCQMSAFEYLVSRSDETAHRMVRESFRTFVAEDVARGGDLIATLQAYAAADLNATLTAERLHMHVNTVRYRLARIEERAGCDLHQLAEVLELLLAARFESDRVATG